MTTVTARFLTRVRSGPGPGAPTIARTRAGERYEIVETAKLDGLPRATWYLIAVEGEEIGWVPKSARGVATFREPVVESQHE